MKSCPRCGLDGDSASFYPAETHQKWCRRCVEEHVRERHNKRLPEIQQKEREQEAIRNLVSQLQPDKEPMVYLVRSTGGLKIGYSTNVAKRIRQFNTALSVTCELLAIAPGGRSLERDLHHKHRLKRLNREWFANSPQILKNFMKLDGAYVFQEGMMSQDSRAAVSGADTNDDIRPKLLGS